jgi:hypothetical protein
MSVDGETVYFTHFKDNCVYRMVAGEAPVQVTQAGKQRFADFAVDRARQRLIAVRELHGNDEHAQPTNTICAIDSATAPRPCWCRARTFIRRRACRRTAARWPG